MPLIEISGEVLPNPCALIGPSSLGTPTLKQAFVGKAHGDLHPGNILLRLEPELLAPEFVLVDLARYRDDAPLAQDPAQLLLCLISQRFLSGTNPQREALSAMLSGPDQSGGTLVPEPAADLIKNFWQLGTLRSKRGQKDEWHEQCCLSVVACSLMFLGRRGLPDRDRWWFFQLAARAADTFLDDEKGFQASWADGAR